MKIVILGATGMLGCMVLDVFSREPAHSIIATARSKELLASFKKKYPRVEWVLEDAENTAPEDMEENLIGIQWVINCIGVIKPFIHDDNPAEVERAIRVNSLFPTVLAAAAEKSGTKVIQIATDCVYSGRKGRYTEKDPHDPLDVYGKTKSLGEAQRPNVHHIRCSIIGPEPKNHVSLLDWFLALSANGTANGYRNHSWNGVTTYHFARVCQGIINQDVALPRLHHLIPGDELNKFEMLRCFAKEYNRSDLTINPTEAAAAIDRTLRTDNAELNLALWKAAGYTRAPKVSEMIAELAAGNYNFRW